jgi:hypothetical protein
MVGKYGFPTQSLQVLEDVTFVTTDWKEEVGMGKRYAPDKEFYAVYWRQSRDENPIGQAKYEEFRTIALAMRRMANILEGKVSFLEFATQPSQKPRVV